mmetsp:Transcript_7681/g.26781  ORF Transcript_7681/g.26781 Transcript_7681/m.26781 type:complete len:215 (-) Transcript_7681:214-858(-)
MGRFPTAAQLRRMRRRRRVSENATQIHLIRRSSARDSAASVLLVRPKSRAANRRRPRLPPRACSRAARLAAVPFRRCTLHLDGRPLSAERPLLGHGARGKPCDRCLWWRRTSLRHRARGGRGPRIPMGRRPLFYRRRAGEPRRREDCSRRFRGRKRASDVPAAPRFAPVHQLRALRPSPRRRRANRRAHRAIEAGQAPLRGRRLRRRRARVTRR